MTYAVGYFPLRTVAFRGHGISLLALAKGMSTLFAKNGFSRPSLERYCGFFRHVLFPQMFSVGRAVRSPRTRKATTAFASHEENWFVFSRSQRSSASNNHLNSESERYHTSLFIDYVSNTTIFWAEYRSPNL